MQDSTPSVLSSPETFAKGVPQHSFDQFEELVHNVVSLRRDLFQRYLDPRRNIDKECGFPDSMSAEQYWELYQRDAIAARVVECVPRAVWQKQPTIYEDEDPESQTPFEEAWDTLSKAVRGERSYYQDEGGNPVMSVLERADILSGIGQYGVILLGLDDGLDLREPVAGVEEKYSMPVKVTKKKPVPKPKVEGEEGATESDAVPPGKKPKGQYSLNWRSSPPRPGAKFSIALNAYVQPKSPRDYDGVKEYETFPKDEVDAEEPESDLDGLDGTGEGEGESPSTCRKLLYLRPFPEASAQITHYENNPTCPRYGQPTQYLITFNDSRESSWQGMRTVAPQHQRQVHWTRIVHIPSDGRLASDVFGTERLRQVYRHILSLQKLYHGDGEMYWKGAFPGISFETHPQLGGQVQVDKSGLRSEMEQYQNGLQRFLLSIGMTAKMLSPTVSDPTPHIEVQLTAIAIRVGIPKRILMGSERGELSSSQDAGEWDDQVAAWQTNDRNPRIVIPLVDRFINVGVLPEPCGYSIEWPEISTSGPAERAQVALTLTQAMVAYLGGNGPSFMAPMDYLTRVWDLDEEEAQAIIDNAEAIAEQLAAEQEEQMLLDLDMQEDALDRGIVADPNDPELIPDVAPGGGGEFGGPPESNRFPPNGKPPSFNTRNVFCPTGEGGGVDPSCSDNGLDSAGENILAKMASGQSPSIEDTDHPQYQRIANAVDESREAVIARGVRVGQRLKEIIDPQGDMGISESPLSLSHHLRQLTSQAMEGTPLPNRGVHGDTEGLLIPPGKGVKSQRVPASVIKRAKEIAKESGRPAVPILLSDSNDVPKGWAVVESPVFAPPGKLNSTTMLGGKIDFNGGAVFESTAYPKKSSSGMTLEYDPVYDVGTFAAARFNLRKSDPKGPPKPPGLNGATKIVKNIKWKRKGARRD